MLLSVLTLRLFIHYFIKHLSERQGVSGVIKDAGSGQQKLKKKVCPPTVPYIPSNCIMYFFSKNFPKLSNTHSRVFYLFCTHTFEAGPQLDLHGSERWPFAGGSEDGKGQEWVDIMVAEFSAVMVGMVMVQKIAMEILSPSFRFTIFPYLRFVEHLVPGWESLSLASPLFMTKAKYHSEIPLRWIRSCW